MRYVATPYPFASAVVRGSGHAGAKYGAAVFAGGARRLLSGGGALDDYCLRKVFALVLLAGAFWN